MRGARGRRPAAVVLHLVRPCAVSQPGSRVAVAVLDDGRVLLGRRSSGSLRAGAWALPAGFVEFDEDFLTAGRREVREETGLHVRISGILGVSSNHVTESLHALVVVLGAAVVSGALGPGDEFSELRVAIAGPYPPLAFEGDADLLARLHIEHLPTLPIDRQYAGGGGS